jgi:hypothetical protein
VVRVKVDLLQHIIMKVYKMYCGVLVFSDSLIVFFLMKRDMAPGGVIFDLTEFFGKKS